MFLQFKKAFKSSKLIDQMQKHLLMFERSPTVAQ